MSALAPWTREGKFTAKTDFQVFYVTIADADIRSLKLLDKYLNRMLVKFEQNCMVITRKNLSFLKKMVNHFWQSVDVVLEDVSVTKIIVWY